MKTFKNKRTGETAEEYPDYYRTRYWNTVNDIPKRLVENSCDWEEVVKTPILTTVDGFELFGGESIYGVTDNFQLCYTLIATKENVQRCKIFAKKENAEEYVKQYKNYKTVDGKQIVEGDNFYLYDNAHYKCLFGSFGQFKSSKWDGKRYRTEEEVLQKIREEKPQYSLNQVEKYLFKYLPLNTIYQGEIISKILKNLQNEQ